MPLPEPNADNDYLADHADLLITSYRQITNKHLVGQGLSPAESYRALYTAPFGVVSHTTDADPIFNYGNLIAQKVFELDWAEITQLPSRKSAAPVNRTERAQLLAAVSEQGFMDSYRGERVSATGRRFMIEDATVWNLIDSSDKYRGQAAVFHRWPTL